MNEKYYDDLLHIHTRKEQMGFHKSFHYHRYEPTPYTALEELFRHYELKSTDHVVDFGCGKGRLNFFIHHLFQSTVTGVEMDEDFFREALENKTNYMKKSKGKKNNIHFQCCLAEEYQIDSLENHFYFFNPFSIQIFMKVIHNILRSMETSERKVELILYYVTEDYVHYLEHHSPFRLKKEIVLTNSPERNEYERFLIYGN